MSLIDVPAGELAAVVTYLELRERRRAGERLPSPLALQRVTPDPTEYRALFRAVGAKWLWFSRLVMSDEALGAIIGSPAVEIFEVRDGESCVGMLELDRRVAGACELAFVGLVPDYAGRGHGRWLLGEAVRLARSDGATRVHVHTCSLDHPAALGAYRRAGFVATARKVETFIDPRLAGVLPRDCAPQVPLVDPGS